MSRPGPAAELKTLQRFVTEVEGQFLTPFLGAPVLGPPSRQEILNVAAYVVLVHGAMENFVEGLALWITGRLQDSWVFRKKVTRATAAALLHAPAPTPDPAHPMTVFDVIRTSIEETKKRLSNGISENHGTAVKHMYWLLQPLGVNIPSDAVLTASLESLVSLRHQWAHQYRFGAKVVKSASDAKNIVTDCVALAQKLSAEAAALRP